MFDDLSAETREFRVEIETDIPEPSESEFDELVDALAPVSGVPGAPNGTLAVTLKVDAVDAADAASAVSLAIGAVQNALRAIDRSAGTISVATAPPHD